MGDKGKKDKGKKEHQKKAQLTQKEKRKLKNENWKTKRRKNKCPVQSSDLKSSKEDVCELLEEPIRMVANGGLTSRCTRPELAVTLGPAINVVRRQFRRVNSVVRRSGIVFRGSWWKNERK